MAIVGVSADPAKWGYWFARDAVKRRAPQAGVPRRPNGGEVHGHAGAPFSSAELPEAPELVDPQRPRERARAGGRRVAGGRCARACRDRGRVRRAGGGGSGARGGRSSNGCARPARCSSGRTASASSTPRPSSSWRRTRCRRGRSASSRRAATSLLEVGLLLEDVGLGFSRAVSIGNQADLDATELVAALGEHEGTRVIGVYCEDFLDGRAFVEAARTAGKPVVLLTVGRTAAGSRAAQVAHRRADERPRRRRRRLPRSRDPPRRHAAQARRRGTGSARAAAAARPAHRGRRRRRRLRRDRRRPPRRARPRAAGSVGDDTGDPARDPARRRRRLRTLSTSPAPGEQDVFSFAHSTRALLEDDDVDAVLFTAYFGGYSTLASDLGEPRARRGRAARGGDGGEREAARRPHDALELTARAGAPRGRDARLPRDRVGGGSGRRPRRGRRAGAAAAVDAARAGAAADGRRLRRGARGTRRGRRPVRRRPDGRQPGRSARRRRRARLSRSSSRRSATCTSRTPAASRSASATSRSLARRSTTSRRGSNRSRSPSKRPRTSRRDSSCSSERAATRASGRSSPSPPEGSTPRRSRDVAVALAPVDEAGRRSSLRSLRVRTVAARRSRPPTARRLAAAARAVAALSTLCGGSTRKSPRSRSIRCSSGRAGAVGLDARIVPA